MFFWLFVRLSLCALAFGAIALVFFLLYFLLPAGTVEKTVLTLISDPELLLFSAMLCLSSFMLALTAIIKMPSFEKRWMVITFWCLFSALYVVNIFSLWALRRDRLFDDIIPQMVLMFVLLATLPATVWIESFGLYWGSLLMLGLAIAVSASTAVMFSIKSFGAGLILIPLLVFLIAWFVFRVYKMCTHPSQKSEELTQYEKLKAWRKWRKLAREQRAAAKTAPPPREKTDGLLSQ
jgi:phosphate/sulfate permease